jgi:hypothetical protein
MRQAPPASACRLFLGGKRAWIPPAVFFRTTGKKTSLDNYENKLLMDEIFHT